MAMEPISGVMTIQAQGSAPQRKQEPVQAEKPENMSMGVQDTDKVDNTTNVVGNAREKSKPNGEGQQGMDQQSRNEQIRKAVEQLNRSMENSEAIFGIHEDTNRVTIKIVDRATKEVIKELPPEKTLDMIARVWDLAGILVDEKR